MKITSRTDILKEMILALEKDFIDLLAAAKDVVSRWNRGEGGYPSPDYPLGNLNRMVALLDPEWAALNAHDQPPPTVVIYVKGGVVQDYDLPPGLDIEIRDQN